jgi:hypothetical protein
MERRSPKYSEVGDMSVAEPPTQTLELDRYPEYRAAPRWVVPLAIIAALLGIAGIGVGVYALATQPAKVSGPRGPMGPMGQQGPRGATGKQGPMGTVASTSVVRGSSKSTAPNPQPGTVLDAQTSCPSGSIMVSGGAQVSAPGLTADRNVTLRASFPLNATTWETVALVTGQLGQGATMTMTPYVVCGVAANAGATTTSSAP